MMASMPARLISAHVAEAASQSAIKQNCNVRSQRTAIRSKMPLTGLAIDGNLSEGVHLNHRNAHNVSGQQWLIIL